MAEQPPPEVTLHDAYFHKLPDINEGNKERVLYNFIDKNYVLEEAQRALEEDTVEGALLVQQFSELLIAHLGIPIKTSERLDLPEPTSLTLRQMAEAQAMKVRHARENDPKGFEARSAEALENATHCYEQAGISPSVLGRVTELSLTLPLELVADKQQMAPVLNLFLYHRLQTMAEQYSDSLDA